MRATRCGLIRASARPRTPITPMQSMKNRAGAPTTHSMASRMPKSTIAVPRSSPRMTITVASIMPGTTGIITSWTRPSRRSLWA